MDLIVIVVLAAILTPLLALGSLPEAARVPLGLPFLLFFPGYALVAAIFPKRAWPEPLERLALSSVTSLTVVLLIGIALNYSSWGLRTGSVLAFVGLFSALVSVLGLLHRQTLPANERLRFHPRLLAAWTSRNLRQLTYPGAAALGALAAVAIIVFAVPDAGRRGINERFTEFYLLAADGSGKGYPTTLTVGEPATVTFGIVNREGREAQYAVSLLINESLVREYQPIRLLPGQRQERGVSFSLGQAGEGQVVRLVLRKDGSTLPYRSVHLRLDGRGTAVDRLLAPASRSEAAPESAPPAEPPPPGTPEPLPTMHIVSRGENLTFIASYYGLPLSALLAVNELPDPDLIYPDQGINLPLPSGNTGGQ